MPSKGPIYAIFGYASAGSRMMAHVRGDSPRPRRRLRRAELPVNTVEMAGYPIGRVVVHDIDRGRLSGTRVRILHVRFVVHA